MHDLIERFRGNTRTAVNSHGNAALVSFADSDGHKAQQVAQALVTRFGTQLIDPPSLPSRPVFPNRGMFMFAGFASGIVLAFIIAAVRRFFKPVAPLRA